MKQKFLKLLSLLVSLALIATTCGIAVSAEDSAVARTVDYYVINGGTGDGTSFETPAATVADVVTYMNEVDKLSEGDTANIYIMQRTNWLEIGVGATVAGTADNAPAHGITAWSVDGTVPAHTAQIIVQPYNDASGIHLAYNGQIGLGKAMILNGPTVFKNLTLVSPRERYLQIIINGKEVVFGEGVSYGYINRYSRETDATSTIGSPWDGIIKYERRALPTNIGYRDSSATFEEEINVTFENAFVSPSGTENEAIYISNDSSPKNTFMQDVNLTLNNSEMKPKVYFSNRFNSGSALYERNVNINIKSAASVTVKDSGCPAEIKGGYQVIISGGAEYTGDISTFNYVTAEKGAWYMTNDTEFDDFISFTGTAGTFTVKEGYKAMAVDAGGEVTYSEDGVLTVDAGAYNVDIAKEPVTKDYYVLNGATGDGTSAETPAASVADVITRINDVDKLTNIDTANIYIMQRSDWKEVSINKAIGGTDCLAPEHGITYWAMDGVVSAYEAKLVVKPYDSESTTYLAYNGKIGWPYAMILGGRTEFENITIVSTRSTYQQIIANGNSVKFGKGVAYKYISKYYRDGVNDGTTTTWDGNFGSRNALPTVIGFTAANTTEKEVNVVFENSFGSHSTIQEWVHLDSDGNKSGTYKEDYTLTFDLDNSASVPRISVGNTGGDGTLLEKNLNINVKSPNSLAFMSYTAPFTVNGGLQFILNSKTKLGQAVKNAANNFDTTVRIENFSNVTVKGGVWYITNNSEYGDLISFTDKAGTYTVKDGYTVLAKDADGVKYYSENGVLTLAAGDYTVEVGRRPITKNYYVINGGTGDGTSPESPAATVADVVTYINSVDKLVEDDTANIYIMQRSDWNTVGIGETVAGTKDNAPKHGITYWSNDGEMFSHEAHIVVQPYNNEDNIHLAYNGQIGLSKAMFLGGPTTFKKLNIVSPRERYLEIYTSTNKVVFGEGVVFAYIDRRSSATSGTISTPWDGSIVYSRGALPLVSVYGTADHTLSKEINITFESAYASPGTSNESVYLSGGGKANNTFEKDAFVTINNPNARPRIFLSGNPNPAAGTTIYKGNLNINYIDGGYSPQNSVINLTIADGSQPLVINGGYQLIMTEGEYYTGDIESFTDVTVAKGCWYITNATGTKNALGFTATAGVYTVNCDKKYVYAYSDDSNIVYYGTDTLTIPVAGNWTVKAVDTLEQVDCEPNVAGFLGWVDNGDGTMTAKFIAEGEELTQYADYINYRGNLTNTHTKLTTGDKSLNVVYFGGSVTNGTGASDRDSTSWRGLIGKWIADNFPEANVTNINRAVGESGSYLGSYRVKRDVIAENPDLLFIEYSINDYYSKASYEQAALQYETIVREVRSALPECDIVTILVTDSSQANNARKGTLHSQARAHEEMAALYNIPTIQVGRALADSLPEDWTYDDDWLLYMTDTVHPNDLGYKYYYKVIREFMYNSLIYSENDGTITEYELIDLQSDSLLDGNITVIDVDEELLAKSEELGGSGFEYFADSDSMHTYYGDVRTSAEGAVFVLEMTGTELAAVISKTGTIKQFYVKVDGGEYELKDISDKNPTIIYEGLTSKKHTIYIKPVITAESTGRIAIPAFYTRDAAYQTTKYVHYGDVNVDGEINIIDLVSMKKKMAGNDVYCPPLDIDKNGTIETGDLVKLRQHILGKFAITWEDVK